MIGTITVVIPCFNQGRFLAQAVRSALEQDHVPAEIVVVNDGSTDETTAVARSFGDRIVFREQTNRGAAAARNAGIAAAGGEYIAFLDADDLLLPGSLSTRAAFLDDHPRVGLVCGDSLVFDEDGAIGLQSSWSRPRHPENFRWDTVEYCAHMCTVMLRRQCVRPGGAFDEDLTEAAEDWSLWVRVARHHAMTYLDRPLAARRLHEANVTRDRARLARGHRAAVAKLVASSDFPDYPRALRARLLVFRAAAAWRVEPKRNALRYCWRGLVTDPRQFPFAGRVLGRGARNSVRRMLSHDDPAVR